jgi:hypothetical protein
MTTDVAKNLRISRNMCEYSDTSDLQCGNTARFRNFVYIKFLLQAVDHSQYIIRAMNLNELTFVF